MVISTALFDKPPFKNLIVNGLVLAEDGQKMSKSKKNYPDPMIVVNKYGADALRLYLINSPVVKAESLKFKESGVLAVLKEVFLPWYNAYRFLFQNIEQFEKDEGEFTWTEASYGRSDNVMDKWIVSFTQSLLSFVSKEMAGYRLYTVVPKLVKFIDNLTNWYVRMNRRRLKGEGGVADCRAALETLFGVVLTMVRVMAPFTPFLTENMYQQLRKKVPTLLGPNSASVHYLMLPTAREDLIYEDVERAVARMQSVIDLGRGLRDRKTMPIKYPLPEVVVIHKDQQCLDDIRSLEKYILEKLVIQGHDIVAEDIRIMYSFAGDKSKELSEKYEADSAGDILVMLDTTPDEEMLEEGVAREVINRVQKLRKSAGLKVDDKVTMYYTVTPQDHNLAKIITKFSDYILSSSKTPVRSLKTEPKTSLKKESYDLKGAKLELVVVHGFPPGYTAGSPAPSGAVPSSPWLNMCLLGSPPPSYIGSRLGGLLLPPSGLITLAALTEYAQDIFGLYNTKIELFTSPEKSSKLENTSGLDGTTIYVSRWNDVCSEAPSSSGFNCQFVNVDFGGKLSSVMLENPQGRQIPNLEESFRSFTKGKNAKLFTDKEKKKVASLDSLRKLAGQTVYV